MGLNTLVSVHPRAILTRANKLQRRVHSEMVDFAGGQGGWPV